MHCDSDCFYTNDSLPKNVNNEADLIFICQLQKYNVQLLPGDACNRTFTRQHAHADRFYLPPATLVKQDVFKGNIIF